MTCELRQRSGRHDVQALVRPDRYPRASAYDPEWVLSLDMGPHPLWQLEDLLADLDLHPGEQVLDLGAGRGATSVFLARECGVQVVAADLWIPEDEARRIHDAAGVGDQVTAVNADVRDLPFGHERFDAIVSVDAFEYFGTDIHLLPNLLPVLKPGGRIGMSTPALRTDPYVGEVPDYVHQVAGWEAAGWHSPEWWRRHWELSGLLEDIRARWQIGGRDDWLLWARAGGEQNGPVGSESVIHMLEQDTEEQLGFTLISATKSS